MGGNLLDVLMVEENRGGSVEELLVVPFDTLTVEIRAVLTPARDVVITLVRRVVRKLGHGGNVELPVTDVFPAGNNGNSGSSFCTY